MNVLTGAVWLDQTDAVLRGAGTDFALTRSYNSHTALGPGMFGSNWSMGLERSVRQIDPAALEVHRGDGMVSYYTDDDSDGVFRAVFPATERTTVTRASSGGFVRSFPQGGMEVFDSSGRLLRLVTKAGVATAVQRDAGGRVESVTVPGGRTWRFEYSPEGRIVAVISAEVRLATYTYNADLLSSVVYPDGTGYSFVYDSLKQIRTITDASGRVIESHEYSGNRAITSEIAGGQDKLVFDYVGGTLIGATPAQTYTRMTDALGNVTTFEWAIVRGMRRITKEVGSCSSCGGGASQGTQEWGYDTLGRVTSYRDATGNVTTYEYDSATGDLVAEVYTPTQGYDESTGALISEAGTSRRIEYTYEDGEVTTTTVPGQGTVTMTYDAITRRRSTIQPVSAGVTRTTVVEEDTFGRPRLLTDARAKTTTLAYDAQGNLETITDPLSHTTRFGYDSEGRRTTVTDALNQVTTTTYSPGGRPLQITDHEGNVSAFTYDKAGRRATSTDPLQRTTVYAYDPYGRLQTVTDPLNGTTRYGYDAMSQLQTLTDARGQVTQFEYQRGKVSKVTYPGGRAETFAYYPDGRLWQRTDRRSVKTTFDYFPDGALREKKYSDLTPAVTYTYELGRLKTAQNNIDTLTWTYDTAGQVRSEASARTGAAVAYDYDLAGNRTGLQLNAVPYLTYEYDDASRLDLMRRGSAVFDFSYDIADRRTALAYPNGVVTDYGYDTVNRLLTLSARKQAVVVTDLVYTYDDAANRTSKVSAGAAEQYTYDPLNRLTEVARPDQAWWYGYDAVGNRLGEQVNGQPMASTINNRNELEKRAPGGPVLFRGTLSEPGSVTIGGNPARMRPGNVFEGETPAPAGTATVPLTATDESQNTTARQYQLASGGTTTDFTYDLNGNLLTKMGAGASWAYEWNAENQLTRVLNNGAEVARYAYDPLGRRVEKVAGTTTTSYLYDGEDILREAVNGAATTYIHGPGIDEPLAREDSAGSRTYYHADGLGSVVKETNSTGAVALTRAYDAFGHPEQGAAAGGYAYTSREWDPEAGLYYYRARYYDPKIGRFISEDPIGEGEVSAYTYADNRPTTLTDPDGLQPIAPPAGIYYYICCKGGRMTYCAGNTQLADSCLDACAQKHEQGHINDFCKAGQGDFCEGRPDGPVPRGGPGGMPEKIAKASECKQNKASFKCIKKCPESAARTQMIRGVALAIWDNCGKGPRPPW